MKVKTIKILCGVLAMLAFTACSSNIDDADGNHPQFWHVTLQASMGDETTRALSEGTDNLITASFTAGDVVKVLKSDGTELCDLTAQSSGASTTLEGTISGSIAVNDVLTLRYRSATANYDGQVGTLAGIAASQDYAEGTLTVKTTSPLEFTSNSVTLEAKQSITKFTFQDASTNADISVKTFGIAATGLVQSIATNGDQTTGAVTGTLSTPSTDVYVALRNNTVANQTYSFTVKDNDGNWYRGTKNAKLTNGKNYTATMTLTKLETLTKSSAVGDIGVVSGLPAIAISGNKAVALMNVGALCPEAYGKYYTFANLSLAVSGGWYVPTQAELNALAGITSTWGTQNGVNGFTFTIGSNTLFFPAAGLDDGDNDPQDFRFVSTEGYYWSSTNHNETLAYALNLDNDPTFIIQSVGWYKVDALTVRPFYEFNNN